MRRREVNAMAGMGKMDWLAWAVGGSGPTPFRALQIAVAGGI